MEPIFFSSPEEFRAWLEEQHATASECQVGMWKKDSGKPTLSWSEAVDQALCYGWIDGRQNPIDDFSWTIRFSPRRPRSNWSLVNLRKIEELTAQGLMRPAGITVFEARDRDREENPASEFDAAQLARFQAEPKAWEWFSAQAPSYRKQAIHHVTGAKRPETRERRMDQLIADSLQAVRLKPFRRPGT
ncbi:YdeI/OmpD-associated family protein [Streptomyces bobili]|uniref:YdeI/OmpD-associated family protein n=1 Tax=Streptomyces bobili TaxID=67280 RepID=UPI00224E6101|nr:YdeI/OmpD-associated family protein [Streptomyces bobili]MCX5524946.1 YdeI/OmpD-associated family protein [Streptomyces bobili]